MSVNANMMPVKTQFLVKENSLLNSPHKPATPATKIKKLLRKLADRLDVGVSCREQGMFTRCAATLSLRRHSELTMSPHGYDFGESAELH
jgi:hypothetical protein